jgi:CBS domain-containing protein
LSYHSDDPDNPVEADMVLRDILNVKGRQVHTAGPQDTLMEAVNKLVTHGIGALAVLDSDSRIVGIITERDILRLSATSAERFDRLLVGDHMTRDLVTANSAAAVEEAMLVMSQRRIRHLPVVEEGNLVGIVSQGDLVKASLEHAQFETRQLTNFVMGRYPA